MQEESVCDVLENDLKRNRIIPMSEETLVERRSSMTCHGYARSTRDWFLVQIH